MSEDRKEMIRDMARDRYGSIDGIDFDDTPTVSEGGDNGAYVKAWVWVDFSDTPLDGTSEEEE